MIFQVVARTLHTLIDAKVSKKFRENEKIFKDRLQKDRPSYRFAELPQRGEPDDD